MPENKTQVFAFDRINFILLAIGMAIVIVGFILMSGSGSDAEQFNAAIFDVRHIKVAPLVCLAPFLHLLGITQQHRGIRLP